MLIQGRTPIRRTFRLNQPPKNNNFLPSLFSPSNPTRTTGSNSHSCGLLLPLQSAAIGALHLCNPTQQQQFPRDAAALSHSPSSRAAAKRSTNQMQLPTIEQSATTLLGSLLLQLAAHTFSSISAQPSCHRFHSSPRPPPRAAAPRPAPAPPPPPPQVPRPQPRAPRACGRVPVLSYARPRPPEGSPLPPSPSVSTICTPISTGSCRPSPELRGGLPLLPLFGERSTLRNFPSIGQPLTSLLSPG
jgi:hypothetical protein